MNKLSILLLLCCFGWKGYGQNLHRLDFQTAEQMYNYFEYAPGKKIISGHRGTMENGLPENSIPAMEAVLRNTTAIFEVDPRLTKDSVIVMVHDETLDRTTNGTGKVSDYTWAELKKLRLKNHQGEVTEFRINTLEEMILWAKGKTILNLDKKDVPLASIASIIEAHDAYSWVWVTVHNVAQAQFYLDRNPKHYFSMHIRTSEALDAFKTSGLPYDRMIVYIGPEIKESNQDMYAYFNRRGVMCMISTAPSYDKLETVEMRADKYKKVFSDGASILESDLPIEVSRAIQ